MGFIQRSTRLPFMYGVVVFTVMVGTLFVSTSIDRNTRNSRMYQSYHSMAQRGARKLKDTNIISDEAIKVLETFPLRNYYAYSDYSDSADEELARLENLVPFGHSSYDYQSSLARDNEKFKNYFVEKNKFPEDEDDIGDSNKPLEQFVHEDVPEHQEVVPKRDDIVSEKAVVSTQGSEKTAIKQRPLDSTEQQKDGTGIQSEDKLKQSGQGVLLNKDLQEPGKSQLQPKMTNPNQAAEGPQLVIQQRQPALEKNQNIKQFANGQPQSTDKQLGPNNQQLVGVKNDIEQTLKTEGKFENSQQSNKKQTQQQMSRDRELVKKPVIREATQTIVTNGAQNQQFTNTDKADIHQPLNIIEQPLDKTLGISSQQQQITIDKANDASKQPIVGQQQGDNQPPAGNEIRLNNGEPLTDRPTSIDQQPEATKPRIESTQKEADIGKGSPIPKKTGNDLTKETPNINNQQSGNRNPGRNDQLVVETPNALNTLSTATGQQHAPNKDEPISQQQNPERSLPAEPSQQQTQNKGEADNQHQNPDGTIPRREEQRPAEQVLPSSNQNEADDKVQIQKEGLVVQEAIVKTKTDDHQQTPVNQQTQDIKQQPRKDTIPGVSQRQTQNQGIKGGKQLNENRPRSEIGTQNDLENPPKTLPAQKTMTQNKIQEVRAIENPTQREDETQAHSNDGEPHPNSQSPSANSLQAIQQQKIVEGQPGQNQRGQSVNAELSEAAETGQQDVEGKPTDIAMNPSNQSSEDGKAGNYTERIQPKDPKTDICNTVKLAPNGSLPLVALLSAPGSGNTWTRTLIEHASGIYTGSIYKDYMLYKGGLVGEIEEVGSGTTIVTKTHYFPRAKHFNYTKAILLIRNPFNAIVSEFTRQNEPKGVNKSHVGFADPSVFRTINWTRYAMGAADRWFINIESVLTGFEESDRLVVFYETMLNDVMEPLRRILKFLNFPIDSERLKCTKWNTENNRFHRPHKSLGFDPFDPKLTERVNKNIRKANDLINKYHLDPLPKYVKDQFE